MTFPLFDLTGRRALVTGSSQGIGLALAEGLAAHGAEVILNGRDTGKLSAAAERLASRGYRVAKAPFDVTEPEDAAAGVAATLADGPIDILVNNAGMQFRTALEDFPVDKWQQLLATNVSSIFYVSQPVARAMITRGMATDWAKHGLQVNAIAPGYFKTPLNQALVDDVAFSEWLAKRTPAARWGRVEELVGAAVFLAGDASSFVNGHTLYVDGGITASI